MAGPLGQTPEAPLNPGPQTVVCATFWSEEPAPVIADPPQFSDADAGLAAPTLTRAKAPTVAPASSAARRPPLADFFFPKLNMDPPWIVRERVVPPRCFRGPTRSSADGGRLL